MRERGQASVEWVALVCLVAVLAGASALLAGSWPHEAGRRLAPRVLAAIGAPDPPSRPPDPLLVAYGSRRAALVRRVAPSIAYERGMADHPVDPRDCRAPACARGSGPVTLFTHIVERAGSTYVQFWAYYPDSSWNGIAGRHADDWESVQVRVGADGTLAARASAHHGYTGPRIGPDLNVNQVDPDWVPRRWRGGWTRWTGWLRVARHSHAGYVARGALGRRRTPAAQLRLVPLETVQLPAAYAVAPPWRKAVYADPESPRT